jgi:hypothetical protein
VNEIDAYIRSNRTAYTRDALTRRLVDAGHDPGAVEAAWARVEETDPGTSAPPGAVGPGTVLLVLAIVLAYGGAILAAGATVTYGGTVSILMIVYVVAMIGALILSLRRILSAPTTAVGWTPIWAAVGISVAMFVGLSGACFAALGPAMSSSGGTL